MAAFLYCLPDRKFVLRLIVIEKEDVAINGGK
jgi:hypothetical protein